MKLIPYQQSTLHQLIERVPARNATNKLPAEQIKICLNCFMEEIHGKMIHIVVEIGIDIL